MNVTVVILTVMMMMKMIWRIITPPMETLLEIWHPDLKGLADQGLVPDPDPGPGLDRDLVLVTGDLGLGLGHHTGTDITGITGTEGTAIAQRKFQIQNILTDLT